MTQINPRDYALELVENGLSAKCLLVCCLKYMSYGDVRDMLDINDLLPSNAEEVD